MLEADLSAFLRVRYAWLWPVRVLLQFKFCFLLHNDHGPSSAKGLILNSNGDFVKLPI
jgi:hypothetical protein